jgi:TatD DNase family protein
MGWVDTHCHLQLDERDPGLLLERAEGVDWVVVPGVDLDTSQEAALLAGVHPGKVLATAGLHPHEAEQWPAQGDAIAELASKAAAIGETGLDFYRNLSPRGEQIRSFRRQIKLALELGKPIIVHCRDAFADVIALIDESGVGPQTVMHCWTGGPRWTRRFLDLGVMFSFAGPVAFETGDTVRLGAAEVPPERALVETDTPYLAPPPHRGQANEPAWVALVGAALARVWGLGAEEVAAVTTANAGRVFLPAKGGVPPEAGRGMFLPPKGGVPPEAGRGMFLPPKGGVPPQAGRGMFLPPKGGVPPQAGRGDS